MSRHSRRLVVDADVARGSGEGRSSHPRAILCRDFLTVMMDEGHRAVFSRRLKNEWRRHEGRFALEWRAVMLRKRRVVEPGAPADPSLESRIVRTAEGPTHSDAMQKDFHLVGAALVTDRIVASLDRRARNLFAKASTVVREIRGIVWVNPEREADMVISWLKEGATDRLELRLENET